MALPFQLARPAEVVIGVLADTHVPDRAAGLHPGILPFFRSAGVSLILHAGDVSSRAVLVELETLAPVRAVRGNRDWVLGHLPRVEHVKIGELTISLQHGHGSLASYLADKFAYVLQGYRLERYLTQVAATSAGADIAVFGHTHRPANFHRDGTLWFNPGPAGVDNLKDGSPSVGLLRISGRQASGEIHTLPGYRLKQRSWLPIPI